MSFLGNLGKGLHRAFEGNNLAVIQAILAGDYQAAAALRARQGELERQNDDRDAQVIGARNMGFSNDAMPGLLDPATGAGGGEGDDIGPVPSMNASPEPLAPESIEFPGKMRGVFDPKRMNDMVERQFPEKRALALFGQGAAPSFGGTRGTDRNAALQWAATAIRRRADPKAVRARLSQVGFGGTDLAPPDPFSDLVPGGRQEALDGYMAGQLGAARQGFHSAVVPRRNGSTLDFGASTSTDQMQTTNAVSKAPAEAKSLLVSAALRPDDAQEDPFTHILAADERGVEQPDHPRPAARRHDPYSEANLTLGPTSSIERPFWRLHVSIISPPKALPQPLGQKCFLGGGIRMLTMESLLAFRNSKRILGLGRRSDAGAF